MSASLIPSTTQPHHAGSLPQPAVARGTTGLETSAGKGLAILDAFRGDGSLLGISQIAERANLAKSTVHRLLAVMVEQGYIERVDSRYRLGPVMFELGNLVPNCRPRNRRASAMPYMTELYEATHAAIHLAVLDGDDVLYLQKVYGHRAVEVPSRVGGRVPALCTALGKAVLAFSDPAIQQAALARPVPRLTPHTTVNPAVLRGSLDKARIEGVAHDSDGVRLGVCCVAVPVFRADDGTAGGALSLSYSASEPLPAHAIQRLRHAAARIGQECAPPQGPPP
ncbi:IclR family transcriptional regulator [Streptomyces sp. NPDC002143]